MLKVLYQEKNNMLQIQRLYLIVLIRVFTVSIYFTFYFIYFT